MFGEQKLSATEKISYRGFKCRQRYGPLINKRTGKIDAETFAFIKSYAKRWKEKSIFQVLLHYRAARHHDLINMSLQVHIFNQRMVTALQQSNVCILLDRIDPKETNPAHLGPIRQTVHKIPFRFADIPYFDTMYMCDPIIGACNAVTNDDSDQESWDAPLRRNNTISSKITTATQMPYNQSSQTDICGVMDDLISAPFSRDPTVTMASIKRRGSKPPAPLPPEPIYENLKSSEIQKNEFVTSKSSVYKKRAPPKPTGPPIERAHSWGKKKAAPQPNISKKLESNPELNGSENRPKLNPVREMELIGRTKATDSEDEAPFNFQGMLRKTKYNRASMKRTSVDSELAEARERNFVTFESNNNSRFSDLKNERSPLKPPPNSSNLVYQSNKKSNEKMSPGHVNELFKRDDNLNDSSITSKTSLTSGSCNDNGLGVYVQEEIHPGIILEGYAVEI